MAEMAADDVVEMRELTALSTSCVELRGRRQHRRS